MSNGELVMYEDHAALMAKVVAILGMIRESLRGINDALWEICFAMMDWR